MAKNILDVCEVFTSIQGESTRAGRSCFFIRLSGCPLRCSYCDTKYAYEKGRRESVQRLVSMAVKSKAEIIEVTGGEPLAQAGALPLLKALVKKAQRPLLLETSGALSIAGVPRGVCVIMDIKCPASGCEKRNDYSNLKRLGKRDEIKFVISNRRDYTWARAFVRGRLSGKANTVLFSPASGRIKPAELAMWIIRDRLKVRFQLRMHKHIWPRSKRGV